MGKIPASWPRHPLVQREHLRRDLGRLLFQFSQGTVSGPKLLQGKKSPAWRLGTAGTAGIALEWLRVTPASCWSVRGSSQVCPATQTGPGPLTGHTVKLSQNVTVAQQIYQASHDWTSAQHRPCAQNSSKAFSQCFHQGHNNNRTKKAMRPRWTDGQACAWSLDSAWLAAATLHAQGACELPDCTESSWCAGAMLDKSKSSDNCARARTLSTVDMFEHLWAPDFQISSDIRDIGHV